jgi:hypothetical protein
MKFLDFDSFDQDSIDEYKARASYLLDVAQEWEIDNPEFSRKLREFRDQKIERVNELIGEILEEVHALDDYTSHIER